LVSRLSAVTTISVNVDESLNSGVNEGRENTRPAGVARNVATANTLIANFGAFLIVKSPLRFSLFKSSAPVRPLQIRPHRILLVELCTPNL